MKDKEKNSDKWELSSSEKLKLHQLQANEYWSERLSQSQTSGEDNPPNIGKQRRQRLPEKWKLLNEIDLYDWQKKCIDKWFASGMHGTIKVATGAGKTILALGIIEKLQNSNNPDLYVAIVVPTIVLMNQWYDEIRERSNLPDSAIGRLSGSFDESLSSKRRILICVINTAQAKLSKMVKKAAIGGKVLLIVDECHRAGSNIRSEVFDTERAFNLGLSATPEREDMTDVEIEEDEIENGEGNGEEKKYNESFLGRELGAIIYNMTLRDAYRMDILPRFEIRHYGLPLSPKEKPRYDQLTKSIQDARDKLWDIARSQDVSSGSDFNRWCHIKAKDNDELAAAANRFIADTTQRKLLLYRACARKSAVTSLLKKDLEDNPALRAILFHESIPEAMALYRDLAEQGLPAVPENSKLSDTIRRNSLNLFRRGVAQILVSVKSLVEGFNVPAADLGIIVASSSSARQRIQTIGRVLRKHRLNDKEEKHALIHVLYIENTVDDFIYSKIDWDRITGADRNLYYKWDPDSAALPVVQPGPPHRPLPNDTEIDASQLTRGCDYPGKYEGKEYSADSQGNIYFESDKKRFVANPQNIPEFIHKVKLNYGRFKVTSKKNFVLVRLPRDDEWVTLYVTQLEDFFRFAEWADESVDDEEVALLKTGDVYRGVVPREANWYGFRQKRGRYVITKRVKHGEVYARTSDRASTSVRGRCADELINALTILENQLKVRISRFQITQKDVALFLHKGKLYFIVQLDNQLEFPSRD